MLKKTKRDMFLGKQGWYPTNPDDAEQFIRQSLAEIDMEIEISHGVIVPHAGWYYSGKLACQAIGKLRKNRTDTELVIVFGGHQRPGNLPLAEKLPVFQTSFGELEIYPGIIDNLADKIQMEISDLPVQDNTVELQLPLVKYFFPKAKIIAIYLPPSEKAVKLGKVLAEITENIPAVVIGSTDLTHYGPNYGFAPKGTGKGALDWVKNENDANIIEAMLNMDAENTLFLANNEHSACSAGAAAGVMGYVRQKDFECKGYLIDYYTSYDIKPCDSFVGYVGIGY